MIYDIGKQQMLVLKRLEPGFFFFFSSFFFFIINGMDYLNFQKILMHQQHLASKVC